MFVERKAAELHPLADRRQIAPGMEERDRHDIRGHVHMTSAQGGGEGGTQKEDENGQGGEGGQANLDVIFLDDINSALSLHKCSKKDHFY